MEYISTQKYVKVSPRKARVVVAALKGLSPEKAVEVLPYVAQKSAGPIMNVIKTAMANARMQGEKVEDLVFKEIQITEGPRLKRGIAVSRGQYHAIKKRMSHIRIVLTTKNETAKVKKVEQTEVIEAKPVVEVKKKKTVSKKKGTK